MESLTSQLLLGRGRRRTRSRRSCRENSDIIIRILLLLLTCSAGELTSWGADHSGASRTGSTCRGWGVSHLLWSQGEGSQTGHTGALNIVTPAGQRSQRKSISLELCSPTNATCTTAVLLQNLTVVEDFRSSSQHPPPPPQHKGLNSTVLKASRGFFCRKELQSIQV